jgi:predicted nucleic-acid-binding protein
MIGIDTNILVRYITHDDPGQTKKSIELFGSFRPDLPGFICLITLVEAVWVLSRTYGFSRNELTEVLEALLRSREVRVERAELVSQALRTFVTTAANFSDCLIQRCGQAAECEHTVTFDKRAAAAGMRLI